MRIADAAERRTDELSKGNQQKVQFIASIVHDPTVLIMDEPFSGLDPVNTAILRAAFLEMRARGKTLIFSTHQMETVEALCESLVIVDRGRVVVGGAVRDVKRASGRQVVRIALEGEGRADGPDRLGWLDAFPGVRVTRPGAEYVELTVPREVDPQTILHAVLERGDRVARFEIADPSLEEVFIERVGIRPGDDDELAPAVAPAAPHRRPRCERRRAIDPAGTGPPSQRDPDRGPRVPRPRPDPDVRRGHRGPGGRRDRSGAGADRPALSRPRDGHPGRRRDTRRRGPRSPQCRCSTRI